MTEQPRGRTGGPGRLAVALAGFFLLGVFVQVARAQDAGTAIPSPQRDVPLRFPPREET